MTLRNVFQLLVLLLALGASARPLGTYFEKISDGSKTFLSYWMGPLERLIYRIIRVVPERETQGWVAYSIDLLLFSAFSAALTYLVLRCQQYLPLNPQGFGPLSPHLAINTAVSFMTNTSWQSYAGESTLSYFSQIVAILFQCFLSAAVGICVAFALVRGISRNQRADIGCFWVDLVRASVYILLPMSIVLSIFLLAQGVIQNFHSYTEAIGMEGIKQLIAQGPVASFQAIKLLSSDGGGFFNVNASHPFENPTALTNFVEMFAILVIPSALIYMLGKSAGSTRHGWTVWLSMAFLLVMGVAVCTYYENRGNPVYGDYGVASTENMEGKESRFGVFGSSSFAVVTTATSSGAVNSMHDSYTPMGGLVPLLNILLGESIFGGTGSGLYSLVIHILLTVFIAGLMIGRTPEYLGKKIGTREVKYIMFATLATAMPILILTAVAVSASAGKGVISDSSFHGFSEMFYAYTSATGNNGSAFAGLDANRPFWNLTLALAMFVGRFFVVIPVLALAGSLAQKRIHPLTEGSLRSEGFVFGALLISVMLIVGALTFLPALCLGPIAEHLKMITTGPR